MFVSFRGKRPSLLDNLMIYTNISLLKKNFLLGVQFATQRHETIICP